MLTEAFYILFFYFTGEFISYFIDGFIPGSVIGMVLLFLALAFKKVKPEKVKRLSTVLTQNMGLFFVPAGVGLMNSFGIISEYWAVLLIASVVSTILVIASQEGHSHGKCLQRPSHIQCATHQSIKGAMKTKYKFGSLKRRLYPDDNDTDFIANFKQITEI